jgi:hypothetical protein
MISALLLRWWQAAAVALAAVAILGGLFVGPTDECFNSAAGMFAASSAMLIATAFGIRQVLAALLNRGSSEGRGVIFSLDAGHVWATWNDDGVPMPLGSKEEVSEMMEDFLAQVEVGERLARYRPDNP